MIVRKNNFNAASRRKVFGHEEVKYPWGTPGIHLLQFLDEKELSAVNSKIVEMYQKELVKEKLRNHRKMKEDNYE